MKQDQASNSPAIGLDVGTSRIVLARRFGEDYQFRSQLNAFVSVPFSKMTETALRKEKIPFAARDSQIIVHGDESQRFADLLSVETRRPMTAGTLNPSEEESLTVIRNIIEALADDAGKSRQKLCFSIPAPPLNAEENLTYHEAALRQMLIELGFEVRSINEGLAVIYAEMEDSNYTGIGISCGGGLCNVCLAYLSMPALSFSIPKAGDFIDSSAAAVTGELANRIRIVKEDSFRFNGHFADKIHQVLNVYYEDMIQALVHGMKEAFSNSRRMPKIGRPIPIVLSGGTALPKGFPELFEKILQTTSFPVPISEIRLAQEPLNTTAKGALVAALTEM